MLSTCVVSDTGVSVVLAEPCPVGRGGGVVTVNSGISIVPVVINHTVVVAEASLVPAGRNGGCTFYPEALHSGASQPNIFIPTNHAMNNILLIVVMLIMMTNPVTLVIMTTVGFCQPHCCR